MTNYDVSGLKAKQNELDSRRSKLLQIFIPFREGLLEGLEQFTKVASETGVQDVKPFKQVIMTDGDVEVAFGLNGLDLVLVATEGVYQLSLEDKALAAKMFIYLADSEDNKPFVEIIVCESGTEAYSYRVQWPTAKGEKWITGGCIVGKEEGLKTATALVNHFYSFEFYWKEKPTLGMMRGSMKGEKRPIGFLV